MNRLQLADGAAEAIALYELANEGFRLPFSRQRLVSAGGQILPLIAERTRFAPTHPAFHIGWLRPRIAAKRYVRRFKRQNTNRVAAVLDRNPIVALRIAEVLEVEYSPFPAQITAPLENSSWTIPRAAESIRNGLLKQPSLDIPRIILNPSEEDSDAVAILFALLVAYLHKNHSLTDFQADLTKRYQKLPGLVPTKQPTGPLPVSGDVEDLIREWLPHALFYHAIAQRPVNLIVETLIDQKLIFSSGPHLLPDKIARGLDRVLELIKPESSGGHTGSSRPKATTSSSEDIGDIGAASSIMDRIYNWMGPPPTPTSSRLGPSMSSPGSAQ
jgi:hypothetical protein